MEVCVLLRRESLSLLWLPKQNTTDWVHQNLLCHSSGGWKSKIKGPAGRVSGEASQILDFHLSLCPSGPSVLWEQKRGWSRGLRLIFLRLFCIERYQPQGLGLHPSDLI